jgi:hypothetical protein
MLVLGTKRPEVFIGKHLRMLKAWPTSSGATEKNDEWSMQQRQSGSYVVHLIAALTNKCFNAAQ